MKAIFLIKHTAATCLPVVLIGCATTSPTTLDTISVKDAFIAQAKQAEIAKKNIPELKKIISENEAKSIKDSIWIQAQNKTEECKLWFASQPSENASIFWDGGCQDGYALGLGREFFKDEQKDLINDQESTAYYHGGKIKPEYLSHFDRVTKSLVILPYQSKYFSKINTSFINKNGEAELITVATNTEHSFDTGYIYSLTTRSKIPEYKLYRKVANPENTTYFVSRDIPYNTFIQTKMGDETYSISKWFDGSVKHIDELNKKLIRLPEEYIDHIIKIKDETVSAINEINSIMGKSQNMMNYYLDKICPDSVKVTFMPNDRYKEICGENGYFTAYMPLIIKTQKNNLESRKIKYENMLTQQEQKRKAYYQQQMIEAARRQADAAEANEAQSTMNNNINRTNALLNSLGNMGATPIYQRPRANAPTTYSRIGNSIVGSNGTSCSKIGNSIVCR